MLTLRFFRKALLVLVASAMLTSVGFAPAFAAEGKKFNRVIPERMRRRSTHRFAGRKVTDALLPLKQHASNGD